MPLCARRSGIDQLCHLKGQPQILGSQILSADAKTLYVVLCIAALCFLQLFLPLAVRRPLEMS